MSEVNTIDRRRLSTFLLSDVKHTGKTLGNGSYGSVLEVECQGSIYAAKKIHDVLLDQQNEGVDSICQKYEMECRLMTGLRHPNIVQFLGLFFESNSQIPMLVMEKLDMNLDNLLESVPDLSLLTKLSILGNIANGLVYLHSRLPSPIIHRDLTATNVLLTNSLVAKISDLGNCRIPNMQPGQLVMMMSEMPGTAVYMPPEALLGDTQYGTKLDVFSFGHLALYVMIQKSPCELLPRALPTRHPSVLPLESSLAPIRSEAERRKKYFDQFENQLGGKHQDLLLFIRRCLNNQPSLRPHSQDIVTELKSVKAGVEEKQSSSIVLQKMDISKALLTREMAEREKNMKELKDELQTSKSQARCLEVEKLRQCITIDELRRESRVKEATLLRKEEEVQITKETKQLLQDRVARKESEWETQIADWDAQKTDWDAEKAGWDTQKAVYEKRIKLLQEELQRVPKVSPVGAPHHMKPMPDIKWERGPDMPFGMTGNVQSTFVREIMYIGGGDSTKADNDYVVLSYNTTTFEWSRLPPYSSKSFGLVAIRDELILLGGRNRQNEQLVSLVGVYNPKLRDWKYPYEAMPQAQLSPSAVAYDDDWIIVVGKAENLEESFFAPVQLFNYQLKIWYAFSPSIPVSSSYSSIGSSCIIGGNWYMTDGSSNIVHVSLASLMALVKNVHSMDKYDSSFLSSLNISNMKLVGLSGSLLSIQGCVSCPSIFCYMAGTGEWSKAGELPPNVLCRCAVISSDQELWIIGGNTDTFNCSTNQVYVGRKV